MAKASGNNIKAGGAYVELTAKDGKLNAGLKSAQARLALFGAAVVATKKRIDAVAVGFMTFGNKINGVANGFLRGGVTMLGMAAAVGGAFGLLVKNAIKVGDAYDKMSKRTGTSVEWLSQMAYAADMSGASIENVEDAIKGMHETIAEGAAKGTGEGFEWLKQIGLDLKDLEGLSTEEQFEKIVDSLSKVENQSLKAKAAIGIFKGSAEKLLPLIGVAPNIDDALAELQSTVAAAELVATVDVVKPKVDDVKISPDVDDVKISPEIDKVKVKPALFELDFDDKNVREGLQDLGLQVDELKDLTPTMQISDVRRALQKVGSEVDKEAIAVKILPTIKNQSNIEKLKAEAVSLNLVVKTDEATMAARVNDSLDRVRKSLQRIALTLGNALLPSVEKLSNTLLDILQPVNAYVKANEGLVLSIAKAVMWFGGLGAALAAVGVALKPVGYAFVGVGFLIKGLVVTVGIAVSAIKNIWSALAFGVGVFSKIGGGILHLADWFEKIVVFSGKGVIAISKLVSAVFKLIPVTKILAGIGKAWVDATYYLKFNFQVLKKFFELARLFGNLRRAIYLTAIALSMMLPSMSPVLLGIAAIGLAIFALIKYIPGLAKYIGAAFANAGRAIIDTVKNIAIGVKDLAMGFIGPFISAFGQIVSYVKNSKEKIISHFSELGIFAKETWAEMMVAFKGGDFSGGVAIGLKSLQVSALTTMIAIAEATKTMAGIMREALQDVQLHWLTLKTHILLAFTDIVEGFSKFGGSFVAFFADMGGFIAGVWDYMIINISKAFTKMVGIATRSWLRIKGLFGGDVETEIAVSYAREKAEMDGLKENEKNIVYGSQKPFDEKMAEYDERYNSKVEKILEDLKTSAIEVGMRKPEQDLKFDAAIARLQDALSNAREERAQAITTSEETVEEKKTNEDDPTSKGKGYVDDLLNIKLEPLIGSFALKDLAMSTPNDTSKQQLDEQKKTNEKLDKSNRFLRDLWGGGNQTIVFQ